MIGSNLVSVSPDRRRWVLASVLLLLGALVGATAVRQHWLPCRGSMLSGSVLHDYAYGADFSDGCLRAMDSGFGFVDSAAGGALSAESLLGTLAVLLLALAWASLLVGSGWSVKTKQWALLPALASAATLVLNLDRVAETIGILSMLILLAPNVLAVVAFAAIAVLESPGAVVMVQAALVLVPSTAVGLLPTIADYMIMVHLSDANWDAPPGSGYPTLAAVVLIASALLAITLVGTRARRSNTHASIAVGA